MFIKKMVIVSASLLMVACSANQQQTSKLTLAEMEAKASVIPEDGLGEEESSQVESESGEEETVKEQIESEEETLQEKNKPEEEKSFEKDNNNKVETKQEGSSGIDNVIKWDEFFDNEKQDTPSDKFWDLKGEDVVINGFMGEVLSLNGGWFLLIPEPGAECPFDNGDESYWNKIMIVFVEDKKGLRFTNGPLKVTGRLDVGVKVDESNYKTMFRLYDAKFERISN